MKFSDIQRNPDNRMLRQFAVLWILFFGVIAFSQHFRSHNTTASVIVGMLALVVGVPGMFFPRILKPIFVGWMILAFPIGWLVSHVILFLIYWSVFVPVGIMLRRMGHDPLRLRKPSVESYWEQKTQQTDLRRYLKQF